MKKTVALIVLDGWGLGEASEVNPIYKVKPPIFDWLTENFPVTSLQASGIAVGLPWGEVGNSEVGHLTLGAGKVIYQYFPRITLAIQDDSFFKNKAILDAAAHAKKNNAALNFVGLLTAGHVHAAREHILALLRFAEDNKLPAKLHLFADGKDSPPKSLEKLLQGLPQGQLATLVGRYYAMDREGSYDLTRQAYDCIAQGGGMQLTPTKLTQFLADFYSKNSSEEFLPAIRFGGAEKSISDGDAVIFFNFREDSIRQLAEAFLLPDFEPFARKEFKNLYCATFTQYEEKFKTAVAFPPETVEYPLGRVLAEAGKTQLRLAETYKYAHVTYFFNGHIETPFKNEYRVVVPSETIPHPDEHPEMMAPAITDRLVSALENRAFDFILVNYANPDTIAHTGNFAATAEAVRVIDRELTRAVKAALAADAILLITSDHGNAEELANPQTGRAETAHDANPVPLYIVDKSLEGRHFPNTRNLRVETLGILCDVAPTVLKLMDIPAPAEMNGQNLLTKLL